MVNFTKCNRRILVVCAGDPFHAITDPEVLGAGFADKDTDGRTVIEDDLCQCEQSTFPFRYGGEGVDMTAADQILRMQIVAVGTASFAAKKERWKPSVPALPAFGTHEDYIASFHAK